MIQNVIGVTIGRPLLCNTGMMPNYQFLACKLTFATLLSTIYYIEK